MHTSLTAIWSLKMCLKTRLWEKALNMSKETYYVAASGKFFHPRFVTFRATSLYRDVTVSYFFVSHVAGSYLEYLHRTFVTYIT